MHLLEFRRGERLPFRKDATYYKFVFLSKPMRKLINSLESSDGEKAFPRARSTLTSPRTVSLLSPLSSPRTTAYRSPKHTAARTTVSEFFTPNVKGQYRIDFQGKLFHTQPLVPDQRKIKQVRAYPLPWRGIVGEANIYQ